MFGSFSRLPGGDISPARFVKLGTDNTVTAAGATETPWGISANTTRYPAWDAIDDGLCGKSGDPAINIYGPGDDECVLELGGTVARGAYIKATTDGKGVVADTDKDHVGAQAMQGGASGDLVKVKPMRFDLAV